MTNQLKGEFKNFIKSYFKLSDNQYSYLIRKIDNRSVDNAVHKISAAPFRFWAQDAEFVAFAKKHENAQWLLSTPEMEKLIEASEITLKKPKHLSDEHVKKIFLKHPTLFDADFHEDNAGSPATRLKFNLYFYKNLLGLSYNQMLEMDDKLPGFLMANVFDNSEFSVINQIHYFCQTFGVSLHDVGKLLRGKDKSVASFLNIVFNGKPDNNLIFRGQTLLGLGLSAEMIAQNPKLCLINPLDVKIKYMSQRYAYGVQTRQPSYLPSPGELRTLSSQLAYSRAMYIKNSGNLSLCRWYTSSQEEFSAVTGINSEQLAKQYPLTKSTAQEFLKLYNSKNPCKLRFSEQEMSRFVDDEGEAD